MAFSPETYALLKAQGGGGGGSSNVLVIHQDENDTLDKTWQEVKDAMDAGIVPFVFSIGSNATFVYIINGAESPGEGVTDYILTDLAGDNMWFTETQNGYPVLD